RAPPRSPAAARRRRGTRARRDGTSSARCRDRLRSCARSRAATRPAWTCPSARSRGRPASRGPPAIPSRAPGPRSPCACPPASRSLTEGGANALEVLVDVADHQATREIARRHWRHTLQYHALVVELRVAEPAHDGGGLRRIFLVQRDGLGLRAVGAL